MEGWKDGRIHSARLLHILCEIGQVHVALASQRVVHGEGGRQVVARLAHLGELQVVPKQLLVVRMCTVLDDDFGALCGALSAQVGDALFRHDDVDVVLAGVLMADEGHHG